jgi:tetratricopeptide (TPR) repeat protein
MMPMQKLPHTPEVFTAAFAEAKRLHQAGEFKRARVLYQDLVDRHPNETGPRLMIAELDMRDGKLATARAELEILSKRHPESKEIRTALAGVTEELGDMAGAIPHYRRDAEELPNDPIPLSRLATVLRLAGHMDEAKQCFRRLLDGWPDTSGGYVGLVAVDPLALTDDDVANLEKLLDSPKMVLQERVQILFALGTIRDRRKQYDAAFEAYAEANRLRRENLSLAFTDAAAERVLPKEKVAAATLADAERQLVHFVTEMRTMFSAQYLTHFGGGGVANAAPIFIVGMPRSGSTLLEQILSSHPDVSGFGETAAMSDAFRSQMPTSRGQITEAFKQTFYRRVGETYLRLLAERGWDGRRRSIDKMLGNYVNIGMIHLAFPNAVILNSMRDPVDTCFSCFSHLFRDRNELTYDLAAVGKQYTLYRSMIAHWDEVLPGRVHHIQHEELLADPDTQIRRLVALCGLEWNDACLRFYESDRPVRTASASQVRQPLFKSSMARWRRYEKHLGPLLAALGPYAPEGWRERLEGGALDRVS